MGPYLRRSLQLATMGGIILLGALVWRQSTENSFVEACVYGLIALGIAGVGFSEFSPARASSGGGRAEFEGGRN